MLSFYNNTTSKQITAINPKAHIVYPPVFICKLSAVTPITTNDSVIGLIQWSILTVIILDYIHITTITIIEIVFGVAYIRGCSTTMVNETNTLFYKNKSDTRP